MRGVICLTDILMVRLGGAGFWPAKGFRACAYVGLRLDFMYQVSQEPFIVVQNVCLPLNVMEAAVAEDLQNTETRSSISKLGKYRTNGT